MGNFQRNGREGNRGGGFRGGNKEGHQGFGGGRDRNRKPVTLYKAICDKCHKSCEVPFHPSGDKPIYCNECFSKKREGGNRDQRRDFGNHEPRREFNDKGAQSFSQNAGSGVSEEIKKQLSEVNNKIDHLVSMIENLSTSKASTSKVKEVSPKIKEASKVTKAPVKKVLSKTSAKKVVTKKKK